MQTLVGVLFSGENEYAECLESIHNQDYKDYELRTFEFLPKLESHSQLYHSFLDHRDEFEFLIKIDADMVLTSNHLFERIVENFHKNPWMDVFGIAIQDFFSGTLINGLNSYRNNVQWELDPKNVNADVVIVDPERYYFDQSELAPAAIHCKNPSKLQAFHFGVHRGFKCLAPKHSTTHWALLEKTWQNFLLTRDVRLGLAVLGAELVYAGKFNKDDIDYTNPKVSQVLEDYRELDFQQLRSEVIRLRLVNWGFLPGNWRRAWLKRMRSKD